MGCQESNDMPAPPLWNVNIPDHELVKYKNEEMQKAGTQDKMIEQLLLSNKRYEGMFNQMQNDKKKKQEQMRKIQEKKNEEMQKTQTQNKMMEQLLLSSKRYEGMLNQMQKDKKDKQKQLRSIEEKLQNERRQRQKIIKNLKAESMKDNPSEYVGNKNLNKYRFVHDPQTVRCFYKLHTSNPPTGTQKPCQMCYRTGVNIGGNVNFRCDLCGKDQHWQVHVMLTCRNCQGKGYE